eukprot:14625926-Ditylum_brightwellii.AAC.1
MSAKEKKINRSLTSQRILLLSGQFSNVILLIDNFHQSNKTKYRSKSPKKNKGKKCTLCMEKDLSLALKTLKKLNTEINVTSSDHCNTYAKECNKRKIVEEEDEYVMAHGLDVCTAHVDMFKQKLQHK